MINDCPGMMFTVDCVHVFKLYITNKHKFEGPSHGSYRYTNPIHIQ